MIDKTYKRKVFNRAASSYEDYCVLQDKISDNLFDRLELINIDPKTLVDLGCGTGKNTEWLISIAENILAIDLSEEMLSKAKQKINSENVKFVQADINKEWSFTDNKKYDLATFSLVLEHIENLDIIFQRLNEAINLNGIIYIGELHPFKQYNGTKARFETADGLQVVTCFNHNITDYINSAKKHNFQLIDINEYFDENDKNTIPRILTMIFKKK